RRSTTRPTASSPQSRSAMWTPFASKKGFNNSHETPVFDSTRPIAINLRTPGGVKTVRVRFPSDDEWIGRQRRRKVLVKQLGRGISQTTVANGEDVDAALVAKIRAGEDPDVDAFEAMKVVEQLSLAEVDDVVPDGDTFKVTLRVLGATTVHLLKM